MYSVHQLQSNQPLGPAWTLDHALTLADAGGPGRYEVFMDSSRSRHHCFITRREDGTFIVDPRQAGRLTASLGASVTPV